MVLLDRTIVFRVLVLTDVAISMVRSSRTMTALATVPFDP